MSYSGQLKARVIVKLNGVIEKRIEKVCNDEKESRKDLYIKAMSYSGQLKARKHMVMKEHEFHQIMVKPEDLKAEAEAEKANNSAPAKKNINQQWDQKRDH